MKKRERLLSALGCCLLAAAGMLGQASAQTKIPALKGSKKDTAKTAVAKPDTTAKLSPYKKLITNKAIKQKGLMTVDKVDDKWYLEVPDNLLGKDILLVNRISQAAIDNKPEYRSQNRSMDGYAGDEIQELVIRFERKDKSIVMREVSFLDYAGKPGDPMYANVKRSGVQAVAMIMPIAAVAPDSSRVVDITSALGEDNYIFGFDPQIKSNMKLGAFSMFKSYIVGINSYPQNLSFKTVKSYDKMTSSGLASTIGSALGASSATPAGVQTYELTSSWVLLPEKPMKTREFDQRVGYFANGYMDYTKDQQGVKQTILANRFRLEPKPEDRQKYLAGELVEPAKPIVIYIDPTTPEKWVPYLIAGINDWQKAFEKAGFKNAIIGKRAPTMAEDSTWSLEDVRYSALVYKPSAIANASGPHVADPRTGEILETHINWYHNVMQVLQQWYLVQASASDPRARKYEFDDELMGTLIRFVSSHEVGHTLGLRHNFIASNATPVELMRNKAWVEEHGHTASIMDYARFNYVAQPEDHIGPAGLYPRIGDYDKWAIKWGYKWFGDDESTVADEKKKLEAMILANGNNPRLRFSGGGEEGTTQADPRAQTEDLGDDDMKANTYGMKNLQYVAKNMSKWLVKKDGSDYENLSDNYMGLATEYLQFVLHATSHIGGLQVENKYADQASNIFAPTPAAKQREAVAFINRFFLQEPVWLLKSNDINGRIINPQVDLGPRIAKLIMDRLYDSGRLDRLSNSEIRYGKKVYKPLDYLQDLQNNIWSELTNGRKFTTYRKMLQNKEIAAMGSFMAPPSPLGALAGAVGGRGADLSVTEIPTISRMLLGNLKTKINRYLKAGKVSDMLTRAHLEAASIAIDKILKPNRPY